MSLNLFKADMPYVLVNRDTGFRHELECPGKTSIGRGPSNAIQPNSKSVSKQHAEIELFLEAYKRPLVRDFSSRNGTFVGRGLDWTKVADEMTLDAGDVIRFGNAAPTSFLFQWEEEPVEVPVDEMVENEIDASGRAQELSLRDDERDYDRDEDGEEDEEPRNMTIAIEYPANSPLDRLQPVSVRVDPATFSSSPVRARGGGRRQQSPGRGSSSDQDRELDYDNERETDGQRPARAPSPSRRSQRSRPVSRARRSKENDVNSSNGRERGQRRYEDDHDMPSDKPIETLQLRGSRSKGSTRNTALRSSGDGDNDEYYPNAASHRDAQGRSHERLSDDAFRDPFIQPPAPLSPGERGHSMSYAPGRYPTGTSSRMQTLSDVGLSGGPYGGDSSGAPSPLKVHHRSPAGGRYGGPPLHPGTKLAAGVGLSNPHPASAADALERELSALGGAALMDIDDWQPRSQLTLPERREVEEFRDRVADDVRRANKALSGAINFSEWRKKTAAVQQMRVESGGELDGKDDVGGGGAGERKRPWRFADSAAAAELSPPPEDSCKPEVMVLVDQILGSGGEKAKEGDFFYRPGELRAPTVTEDIVLETLGESLTAREETVVGRLDSVVEHMQKIYKKSATACLIDDFDDMAVQAGAGGVTAPPVAVERCVEMLQLACSTLNDLVVAGLVTKIDDAEDERRQPGESEKEHERRMALRVDQPPTRLGDRLRFGKEVVERAFHRFSGEEYGKPIHALLEAERAAAGVGSVVSDASILLQYQPSEKHAIMANTLYPILLGLRPILTQLEMLTVEIEAVGNRGEHVASRAPQMSGRALLQSLNAEMTDGELRLSTNLPSQSLAGPQPSATEPEGGGQNLTARIVSAMEVQRAREDQAEAWKVLKEAVGTDPRRYEPNGGWKELLRTISSRVQEKGAEGYATVRKLLPPGDNRYEASPDGFEPLLKRVASRAEELRRESENPRKKLEPPTFATLLTQKKPVEREKVMTGFVRALLMWTQPKLRPLFVPFRWWRRQCTHPEEFLQDDQEMVPKDLYSRDVRELKSKVSDLEERLHEISVVSDTDAALIAEKALNRELQVGNIGLREEVHTLRSQILDLSQATPAERAGMLQRMLDDDDERKQATREIRALREQLTRLHGGSADLQEQHALKLKQGGLKPSVDRWGTVPPTLDEVKGRTPGGRPAPVPGPPPAGVDEKGRPRLRRGRPWTKAQCRLLSRDDARMIVLNEVRRLRQSFLDGERDKKRLKEQLFDETARNTQLTVAIHTLQDRFLEKEHRMAQMQVRLDELAGSP